MKPGVFWLLLFFFWEIEGVMLKCGEDILVQRGEKKKLRFWSTEDELMKVEMLPERQQSAGNAFLAIYKDLNKYPPSSSDGPPGGDNLDKGESGNESINLSSHLSSRNDVSDLDLGGKPINAGFLPKSNTKPAYKEPLEGEIHEESPNNNGFNATTQKAIVNSGGEEDKKQLAQKEDFKTSNPESVAENPVHELKFMDQETVREDELKEDKMPVIESNYDYTTFFELRERDSVWSQKESDNETVKTGSGQHFSNLSEISDFNVDKPDNFKMDADFENEADLNTDRPSDISTINPLDLNDSQGLEADSLNKLLTTTFVSETDIESTSTPVIIMEGSNVIVTTSSPTESTTGKEIQTQKDIIKNSLSFHPDKDIQTSTGVTESYLEQDKHVIHEAETNNMTFVPPTSVFTADHEREDSTTINPIENISVTLKEENIDSKLTDIPIDSETESFEYLPHLPIDDTQLHHLKNEILLKDEIFGITSEVRESDTNESNFSTKYPFPLKESDPFKVTEDVTMATKKNIGESKDELIESDELHPQKSTSEYFVQIETENNVEQTTLFSVQESSEKDNVELPSLINNQEGDLSESKPLVTDEKNNQPQKHDILANSEFPFGTQELQNIMNQLKSQEDLLSRPTLKNESQADYLPTEGQNETIDLKINILKNIIKGIASQIASNENNLDSVRQNGDLKATHVLHQSDLNDKTFSNQIADKIQLVDLSSNDNAKVNHRFGDYVALQNYLGQYTFLNQLTDTTTNPENVGNNDIEFETATTGLLDSTESVTDQDILATKANQHLLTKAESEELHLDRNKTVYASEIEATTATYLHDEVTNDEISLAYIDDLISFSNRREETTEVNTVKLSIENGVENTTELYQQDEPSFQVEDNLAELHKDNDKEQLNEDIKVTEASQVSGVSLSNVTYQMSQGIFKETTSFPLKELEVRSDSDLTTGTTESVVETTVGLMDGIKMAYNKIFDGLSLSLTTISPNSLNNVDIETNRSNSSSDQSQKATDGMYNHSSPNFMIENFIADDYISDENDNSGTYVTTTENLNYVQTSLPLSDININENSGTKLANESENQKYVGASNMEEIFLPLNFFNENSKVTIESTDQDSTPGYFNDFELTTPESNVDQTISSISLSIKEHLEGVESTTIKNDQILDIEEEKDTITIPPTSNTTALLNDRYDPDDLEKTRPVMNAEDRNKSEDKSDDLKDHSLPPKEILSDSKSDLSESNSKIQLIDKGDKESGNVKPQSSESSDASEMKLATGDSTFARENVNVNIEHDKSTAEHEMKVIDEASPFIKDIIDINKQDETNNTDHEIKIINEDSVFSKETGSYNILSLIRNALLNQNIRKQSENIKNENMIPIPFDLASKKKSETPEVLIEEQGSKVFIHKPQTNLESEVEGTPFITTPFQARDPDGLGLEMTTLALAEEEEEDLTTTPRNDFNELSSLNNVDANASEFSNSLTLVNSFADQTTTVSPGLKTYVPLVITHEGDSIMTSEHLDNPIPTPVPLRDAVSDQEEEFSPFIKIEPGFIDLLQNYFLGEEARDNIPKENVNQSDIYHRNDENANVFPETSSWEKNHQGLNVRLDDIPVNKNEPIQYILQTRKGLVESDPLRVSHGHLPQQRRDDSPNTYQQDSPFFIKLPGSPVAVPVFLQYEPVKVKYVDVDEDSKTKPVALQSEIDVNKMENDKLSEDVDITQDIAPQTETEYSVVEKNPTPSQGELDFHDRPDPFYVMDPPNLGKNDSEDSDDLLPNDDVSTYSIDVKENLNFYDKKDVVKGEGAVYPGEYFIKNPDNSYSSSDTTYLTNSVFSLGSKITRPSPKPDTLLQYTPFPITPNPPIMTTLPNVDGHEDSENEITPYNSPQTETSTLTPELSEEIATLDNELGGPPSMLFSPAPSIAYSESFGPYDYPNMLFNENENVDDNFFEESSLYPPKNEKTVHDQLPDGGMPPNVEPQNDTTFITPSNDIRPKEDENFDIVALVNFLDQNKKVWPNSKVSEMSEKVSWPISAWDTSPINYQEATDDDNVAHPFGASPWLVPEGSLGDGRDYSAFYSAEDIPGLDPVYFSYRSMPFTARRARRLNPEIEGILKYLRLLPLPLQRAVMDGDEQRLPLKRRRSLGSEFIYCEWNIKTEPGLYLLVTFHNLSAPYTIDCHGAYIEVERENNGYDARWCGNRSLMKQTYSRPHVIFAKTEVRITVYDNGDALKSHPTGFEAEIEVIDLFNKQEYDNFLEKKASPKIRRLLRG